jgi:hypothetical protein
MVEFDATENNRLDHQAYTFPLSGSGFGRCGNFGLMFVGHYLSDTKTDAKTANRFLNGIRFLVRTRIC